MADKNIEIKINTLANTAGAEAAEKSLVDLERRTEAVRESEAAASRETAAAAQAEQQAQDTAEINRKATALVLQQVGQEAQAAAAGVREFAKGLKEVDPESAANLEAVAKGLDLVNLSAQGAALGASVGGPFGAAFGAVVLPAVTETINEIQKAMLAQGGFEKLLNEAPIMATRAKQVKDLMNMQAEITSWENLTEQIKAAAEELELMATAVAVQKGAKVQLAESDVRAARASGGDVEGAEKLLRQAQDDAFNSEQENKLKIKIATKEAATTALMGAEQKLHALNTTYFEASATDQVNLKKKMEAVEQTLDGLRDRVKAADDALYLAEVELGAKGSVREKDQTTQGLETGQTNAVEVVKNLVNDVQSKGGGSQELQQVTAELQKAISDSTLDPTELQRIPVIMSDFRDQILRLGVSFDVIDAVNKNMDALIGKMQQQKSFAEEIANRVSRLEEAKKGE